MNNLLRLLSGQKIQSPVGTNTRPTSSRVRESLINILGKKIENSNLLDLCSGSGVIGCEAIQHGAKYVLAVEINKGTAQICKENLKKIAKNANNHSSIEVINSDVIALLKKGFSRFASSSSKNVSLEKDGFFNLVYLDPPYRANELYENILENLLWGNWVKQNSLVICEFSSKRKIMTSPKWLVKDQRLYGQTSLLFLSPNQASHYLDDTDSKH